jgi:hypothetical protein
VHQRQDPGSFLVGFDPHHYLTGCLFRCQLCPARWGVLGHQRMQPGDAINIVVILRPVIPDEQHPHQPLHVQVEQIAAPGDPLHSNDQVLTPERARHPISSPVTGEPASARSVNRPHIEPERVNADPPAAAAVEPLRSTRLISLEKGSSGWVVEHRNSR